MEKLLVLVLVLGLASLAGAAQIWTITGSTATQIAAPGWEVNPGDTLSMALSSNSSRAAGVDIDIITDNGSDGAFTGASVPNLVYGNAGMSVASLDALLVSMSYPVSGYAADDWSMVRAASDVNMVPVGETLMTLSYTVGAGLGLVTINGIADPDNMATWGLNLNQLTLAEGNPTLLPVSLNVIPEPTTIAMLCLGGLFLRRKK